MSPVLHKDEFKQLTEVGSVARGKSRHRPRNDPQLYGGPYPFVQTGDVKAAPFYLREFEQKYSERGLAQSKLWPAGTLCITIAANIAETAILGIPACFPDSIIGFTADPEKSDAKYIKYCLDTYKQRIQAISQGTTQDNLSVEKLLSFRFRIPCCEVQRKIAALLSTYDDLIENNRRRIALLERMAEQLYREWFVRFRFPGYRHVKFVKGVPSEWNSLRISDVMKFEKGKNPDAVFNERRDDSAPYITIDAIEGGDPVFTILNRKSVLCESSEILMVMDGARSGMVARGVAGVVGSTLSVLRIKSALRNILFEYMRAGNEVIVFNNTGSAVPHASKDFINRMIIRLPKDDNLIARFNEQYDAIRLKTERLVAANVNLAKTRNLLLPRLISGKLRVDDLDIQFPPSMQAERA